VLSGYQSLVEALSKQWLAEYTERISRLYNDRHATAKEINDPVWGTLTLSPLEVLILDSPLFQRLRRIKQLGVAHWVYPAATHTRLEHSIGALHLTHRLLAATNAEETTIPTQYARAVRVASLCHDVGHGVMSHVAENASHMLRTPSS
jgi:HD superfamily phosphohydrolase